MNYGILIKKLEDVFFRCPSQKNSPEDKDLIVSIEKRKVEILNLEEESWYLKSRVVWLKSEERNTKIFHKFVEH